MQAQFWLQRWQEGQIGFHRDEVMPLLEKHWSGLQVPTASLVFVPLAGKSKDMLWLASQGYRVLGVELSPLAVEQFFDENKLAPVIHDSSVGRHFVADNIELICGDVFALDASVLSGCSAMYDRAALIALPVDMRQRYASHVTRNLPGNCQMLLITVNYAQSEMDGPPFSVNADEVQTLYGGDWQITMLERGDILAQEPRFVERGLSALQTTVFQLQRPA